MVFLLNLWHFIINHVNRYEGHTNFSIYVVTYHLECSRMSAFLCKHFYANWRLEYDNQAYIFSKLSCQPFVLLPKKGRLLFQAE